MAYDISINISASGAEAVEREFKKIEAAYRNLQNMGMNFSQASGIKSLSQDISSLATSINTFSSRITAAISQVNSLAAAIKTAATNAQTLSNTLNVKMPTVSGAATTTAATGGGTASSGRSSSSGLTHLEAAQRRANKEVQNSNINFIKAQMKATDAETKLAAELGADADYYNKLSETKRRSKEARERLKYGGGFTPGFDPSFSGSGMKDAALNRNLDELRSKYVNFIAGSRDMKKHAADSIMSGLSGTDLSEFQRMLAIDGNKPSTMWGRFKNNIAASPFGMASLFMLRYRMMTGILGAITASAAAISGHSRQDMVDPNFQLASIGFDTPMRASMEANAVGLSKKIPGLTMPQYFNAAAQVGSALDVNKHGQDAIARGTKAALVFGSLSNLSPDKSGELISNTYFALKDTPEFKNLSAGKSFEKIAGSMFSAISVSGAWGPDIQKAMAHFSPMGAKAGMSLDEMLAYVSTLKTQGFHPGSAGRGGKWLFGDKGYEFMARSMLFGGGEAGVDFYDVRTQEAMDALKSQGVKPGKAKQINEDAVRYLKPILAARMAEDPIGTLAMIGEKVKSSLASGFDFKDLKASQDFLAQFSKTFLGGGVGDIQETLKRMRAEGGWEGANKKYDEANADEPGAAWRKFYGAINNFSDALSNTTSIFKKVDDAASFLTNWSERLTRETELNKGGNVDPRSGRKFTNKDLAYAHGSAELAYSGSRVNNDQMRYLMESVFGEDSDTVNKTIEMGGKQRLGLEKEYYANKWQQTIWPKELIMSGLFYKKLFNYFGKKASNYGKRFGGWLFGKPEDTVIKPLIGDTSGIAQSIQDSLAVDKLNASPYSKGIEYRDRPDLLYTPADKQMFMAAKQAKALATLKNSQFTGTAPYIWSKTWRSILGVESIQELLGRENFTPDNPPPIIDYKWGEGMSNVPGEPRMAQFFGDNMELPSPQKSGQALDLGPVNSSLAELVSSLQRAASQINNIDIKGPSGDNASKPGNHKWGKPI